MINSYINEKREVFYDNGHKCGSIKWDALWKQYRFVPAPNHDFSPEWMIDIANTIKRGEFRR